MPIFYGTKVSNTVHAALKEVDPDIINYDFGLLSTIDIKNNLSNLSNFREIIEKNILDNEEEISKLHLEKYDYLLPHGILKKALIQHFFDYANTVKWLDRYKILHKE